MEERKVLKLWTLWSSEDNATTGSPDFLGSVTKYDDGGLEVASGDLGEARALQAAVDPKTVWIDDTANMN